jgi:ribosomal protein S18 acetylase RimI-like enzyme
MSTPESSAQVQAIQPKLRLSAANFPRTAGFTCARRGEPETRWEQDVSEWLRAPLGSGGALDAITEGQAEVWLYEDADSRLVGFGSLGIALLPPITPGDVPMMVYAIPYFGIHTDFRGKPDGPREQRYAWRIFQGLIDEAERRGEYPLLTLYVDPENPAYRGFYPPFGFQEVERITIGEREWVRMARRLNSPRTESTTKE